MYRLIIADDERIVLTGIKNTIDWASLDVEVDSPGWRRIISESSRICAGYCACGYPDAGNGWVNGH